MNKDLLTLYSVFDLLNNKEISHSPSMSNPATYNFTSILNYLERIRDDTDTLNQLALNTMKDLLNETNQCYYQDNPLREPVRINNCPYLTIIQKLEEQL